MDLRHEKLDVYRLSMKQKVINEKRQLYISMDSRPFVSIRGFFFVPCQIYPTL